MDKNWKQIDDDMQRGYSYAMDNDSVSACNEWKKVWDAIIPIMDSDNYNTISDLDGDFKGTQLILQRHFYQVNTMNTVFLTF